MAAILAWLLKNPLLILAGVLGLALGVQTWRLASAEKDLAREQLAFLQFKSDLNVESARVTKETADKSVAAMNNMAGAIQSIHDVGTEVRTEIRYVQSNGGPCVADPAYLAWVDGVQRIKAARDGRGAKTQDRSGAPPTVRGTGTPVTR